MSQSFSINSKLGNQLMSGRTLSYLGSIILVFTKQEAKIFQKKDFKDFLNIYSQAGWLDYIYIDDFPKDEFMEIFNSFTNAYSYFASINREEKNLWVSNNTIYGHVENLWDTTTWAGKYKNHKGEERDNNMKNVLEDILDMMKLDERFDPSLVDEKTFDEISKILKSREKTERNNSQGKFNNLDELNTHQPDSSKPKTLPAKNI